MFNLGEVRFGLGTHLAATDQSHGHSCHAKRIKSPECMSTSKLKVERATTMITETEVSLSAVDSLMILSALYTSNPTLSRQSRLVMILHCSGLCVATLRTEKPNCQLAFEDLVIVGRSVDHRLAREHEFRTTSEDAWKTVCYVRESVSTLDSRTATDRFVDDSKVPDTLLRRDCTRAEVPINLDSLGVALHRRGREP